MNKNTKIGQQAAIMRCLNGVWTAVSWVDISSETELRYRTGGGNFFKSDCVAQSNVYSNRRDHNKKLSFAPQDIAAAKAYLESQSAMRANQAAKEAVRRSFLGSPVGLAAFKIVSACRGDGDGQPNFDQCINRLAARLTLPELDKVADALLRASD